jgi:hypothetical protein
VVYNYSASKVEKSNKVDGCRNTIKNTADQFIKHGLAHKSKEGHLILEGKNTLCEAVGETTTYKKSFIRIDPSKCIKTQLRASIIKTKFNQIIFAKLKQEIKSPRPSKKLKAIVSQKIGESGVEISNKVLAKVLGVSVTHAARIMKQLCKLKFFIKKKAKFVFVRFVKMGELKALMQNLNFGEFIHNGKLYLSPTTKYKLYKSPNELLNN